MGYLPMRSGILVAFAVFGAEAFIDPSTPGRQRENKRWPQQWAVMRIADQPRPSTRRAIRCFAAGRRLHNVQSPK
jgi:hypothetical protein